jgi:HAD superfamily hydrolase (TIGR01509 family)
MRAGRSTYGHHERATAASYIVGTQPRISQRMTTRELVIFNVDGALVDNAHLRTRAWTDTLAAFGQRLDEAAVARRLDGRGDRAMLASVERELGRPLGEAVIPTLERRLGDAYRRELRPVTDALGTIRRLRRPVCAISGASRHLARLALERGGLWDTIAPNLFTTEQVASPPPAADLVHFAAAQMGMPVSRCRLVDASENGVRSGRAAGMIVYGFAGGGPVSPARHAERLQAAGAHLVFDRMSELAPLMRARVAA